MKIRRTFWRVAALLALVPASALAQHQLLATHEDAPLAVFSGHVPRWTNGRLAACDPCERNPAVHAIDKLGNRESVALDIASFVWSEIHAWAIRLLHDVHALALAYGWREVDILTMSPWRRQAYLELIGQ